MQTPSEPVMANARGLAERCRPAKTTPTPEWVPRIRAALPRVLLERHLCMDGPVPGLARRIPDAALAYDESGTLELFRYAEEFGLWDRIPGWDDEARRRAVAFWQGWQDPRTGRFSDPRNPQRTVNEKMVVNLLKFLGAAPLYPWSTTSNTGRIDPDLFLQRCASDPDWANGGWGAGSHTGFMAMELLRALEHEGQSDLKAPLERGIALILSHQDADGFWGPPQAPLFRRLSGALKVLNRFYFRLGMPVPRAERMLDNLLGAQARGDIFASSGNCCIPWNTVHLLCYCTECTPYRRGEVHEALGTLVRDMKAWVCDDGSVAFDRGRTGGAMSLITRALGICGAYLNWADCPFPNALLDGERGIGYAHRIALDSSGRIRLEPRVDTESASKETKGPSQ